MSYEYNYRYNWGLDPEPSYSASSVSDSSDSAIATQYALKVYAERLADRMADDNLDKIDKNTIAGLIYAVLMQDADQVTKDRPGNEKLFKDEEFEI